MRDSHRNPRIPICFEFGDCRRGAESFLAESGDLRLHRDGGSADAHGVKLICCAAKEEVETWLLAGHVATLKKLNPESLGRPGSGWEYPVHSASTQMGDSSR